MRARLRITVRVIAVVLIPLVVLGLFRLVQVYESGRTFYPTASGDEAELETELARCDVVDDADVVVRFIAGASVHRAQMACARLRQSRGDARERLEASSILRAEAFAKLEGEVRDRARVVAMFGVALIVACLLAALGLGRIAAGTLATSYLFGYVADVLPITVAASVAFALLFLACASYDETRRTPSDTTAALIVSLVLVPLMSVYMVVLSFGSGSGHADIRIGFAVAVSAIAWATTGVPLLVLVHRAKEMTTPPPRMLTARIALGVLAASTGVAFFGAIAAP